MGIPTSYVRNGFIEVGFQQTHHLKQKSAPPTPTGRRGRLNAMKMKWMLEKRVATDLNRYTLREFITYFKGLYTRQGYSRRQAIRMAFKEWERGKRSCAYCSTFKDLRGQPFSFLDMEREFGRDRAKILWKRCARHEYTPRTMWEMVELYERIPSNCGHAAVCGACDLFKCEHHQHSLCNRFNGCQFCHH